MWMNLKKKCWVLGIDAPKDFLKQSFIYDTYAVVFSLGRKLLLSHSYGIPNTKAARDNSFYSRIKTQLPQASAIYVRSIIRSERHTYFICFTPNNIDLKRGHHIPVHFIQTSWQKTHFHLPGWGWAFGIHYGRNLLTCALPRMEQEVGDFRSNKVKENTISNKTENACILKEWGKYDNS